MQITIVGGGFGGVKAALTLSKKKNAHIPLLPTNPTFSTTQHFTAPPLATATYNHGYHLVKFLLATITSRLLSTQ